MHLHPDIHMEIARQRRDDLLREARNHVLAAEARGPRESFLVRFARRLLHRKPQPRPATARRPAPASR